jgi:hypothetical protein
MLTEVQCFSKTLVVEPRLDAVDDAWRRRRRHVAVATCISKMPVDTRENQRSGHRVYADLGEPHKAIGCLT